jgi:AcrR family transcriptional regulator
MAMEPGLRERRKRRTRDLIAETARSLFIERGFDSVTVADVARAADVSEGTVFNYFPTKEDLFFSQMVTFESELIEAVRARAPGEPVLTSFRRVVLDGSARLASKEVAALIATAARIIMASPALRARELGIVARYTHSLAMLIAEETDANDDDVEPFVVANALMGVQRALVDRVRSRVLSGLSGPSLAADARSEGERVFGRLERGLGDFAPKQR